MAKNNTDVNNLNGLGEISTIRDILMGDKMNVYESRFNELSAKLNTLQQQLNEKATASEMRFETLTNQVDNDLDLRLAKIEKNLEATIEKLSNKIEKSSKTDNARIGKLLIDFGKKLGGE